MAFIKRTSVSRLIRNKVWPGIIVILSLSLLSGFVVNLFSPKGIALFGDWDTAKGVISARTKQDTPIQRDLEIHDVRIAKEVFDGGRAVFVDARSRENYTEGHIRGAVSFPTNQFDEQIEKFIEEYPFSTEIVTYCSGRECEDSHTLARYLLEEGYSHVRVFIDGYPGWEHEGYAVEN
jgi:rhodanese-related sulfurtransferase